MRILFLSAEIAPFVSVGGLSQVMYFLPKALHQLGHDTRLFTAYYGAMEKTAPVPSGWKLKTEAEQLLVPIEDVDTQSFVKCKVSYVKESKQYQHTYFLENHEYYKMRANVFSYVDDHIRFALLSKGCLEWLYQKYEKIQKTKKGEKSTEWWPEIIHCNDWHTGYFIDLARRNPRYSKMLAKIPIVYTVHNFSYQGNYDFRFGPQKDHGVDPLAPLLSSTLQRQNALRRGLLHADAVNTVSQAHAVEVLTPEYASGLEDVLYEIRGKLTGILNGLDIKEFNPATDPIIKKNFNAQSFIKERKENKMHLQKEFSLPVDESRPVLFASGRLAQQKGWDLLLEALPHVLVERPEVQLIVLGTGDDRYRERLEALKKVFPDQIGLHLRSDFRLPRKLFAGGDIILIPSMFEPGGIVALEAMRYGAVPLVRRTGGLKDIVQNFNPNTGKGNGFSFQTKDAWSLYAAMIEALTTYKNTKVWNKLVENCLKEDFSWAHSAKEYERWYSRVIEERKRATSITPHPAYGSVVTSAKTT